MDFTPAQKRAIDEKNCSLLVAAGAGSGKTRVLTERIISKILDPESNADITDFLIVTFTNAAAKEMSERIRKALTKRSSEFPENKKLIRNIALLPYARISTINSFCFDLVKENYQKLGLPPKLRIAEDSENDVMLDAEIADVIEERLENYEKYEFFTTVYENFSGKKSEGPFSASVKKFYQSLTNTVVSKKKYLEECCEKYREVSECSEIFDTFYGKMILGYTQKDLEEAKKIMLQAYEMSRDVEETFGIVGEDFQRYITNIDNALSSCKNGGFEAVLNALDFPHFKKSTKKKQYKEFSDEVYDIASEARDIIKALVSDYYSSSADMLKKCAGDYFNILSELSDIVSEVEKRFAELKMRKGVLSFSDVEAYALKLLYSDAENGIESPDAKMIAETIKELYIDEYQDINPIEDMIFRALSKKDGDGNECNRFLVGDSKQSIYGFRGTSPKIFNSYRSEFSDVDDSKASRKRIFMQNNFRCSESVIDFTNLLFGRIMPNDYDSGDRLIFSKNSEKKIEEPAEFIFLNTQEIGKNTERRLTLAADAVYEKIQLLVNNPDVVGSEGKPYTYGDTAVLTRGWKEAVFLERYFSEKGIAVVCEKGESLFEREEIKLAVNILRSVDNPERNICTAGFMRSAIGGFGDDELALIRLNENHGSIFSAAKKYPTYEKARPDICKKISDFLTLHGNLRKMSRACTVSEFVRKMYSATDIVNVCTATAEGNGSAMIVKKNLTAFYNIAREYDKTSFKGISAFLEYIDAKISDKSEKSASPESNGIKIMTIHKSKGLEFPICIVFACDKNAHSASEKIMMNDCGVIFKLKSLEKLQSINGTRGFITSDTPFCALIKRKVSEKGSIEDRRLLYVALTRAVDRLCVVSAPEPLKDFEKVLKRRSLPSSDSEKTLNMWILGYLFENVGGFCIEQSKKYIVKSPNGRPCLEADVRVCFESENNAEDTAEELDICDNSADFVPNEELLESIKKRIDENRKAVEKIKAIPPKLTVSMLKHGLIDYEDAENSSEIQRNPLEMPEFIRKTSDKTAAEKGTAMHTFLQFAVFERCERDGCTAEAQILAQEGFITEKQRDMLDFAKLDGFFATELYCDIKSAVKIHRELRFNLSAEAKDVIAGAPETSDFVLVQGVIDCFIENSDGTYTVIDFKTDRVGGNAGLLVERYKNQLAFYCRAVEDITKKKVSKAVIFSFDMMKSIELEV